MKTGILPLVPSKIKALIPVLVLALSFNHAKAQSAFSDNFNRVAISPGGTPSVNYTTYTTGAGTVALSTDFLLFNNGNPAGRSFISAPLSGYANSFNTKLALNANPITWTVNARTSKTSVSDGFNNGKYGLAIVISSTQADFLSATAQGYAVVYGGNNKKTYRLVKFTGGLGSDASLTNIISSNNNDFTNNEDFVSLRLVYTPALNSWSLYLREDGIAWADPSTGVNTLLGTATDNTYTLTTMTSFGYFWNYGTSSGISAQYDNFSVNGGGPAAGPVPVTFTSITAGNFNKSNVVNWRVENEINLDSYSLERSENGITFSDILSTPATGAGAYSATDLRTTNGSNYYRVRAISKNGFYQYSKIVKVNSGETVNINVQPNPVLNKIVHIELAAVRSGKWNIRLVNVNGSMQSLSPLSVSAGAGKYMISLPAGLATGNYKLTFTDEENNVQVKNIMVL